MIISVTCAVLSVVFAAFQLSIVAVALAVVAILAAVMALHRVEQLAQTLEKEKLEPQARAIASLPERPPEE